MSTFFTVGDYVIHDTDDSGLRSSFRKVTGRDVDRVSREIKRSRTTKRVSKLGRHYGRGIGYGVYVWSYPVTLIDGPLPVIDLAWLVGFYKAGERGATIGGDIGGQLNLP